MESWRMLLYLACLSAWFQEGCSEMVAQCPPNYIQKGDTSVCYLFHSGSKRSWFDASTYCERENGYLATIETSDMADWLNRQIAKTGVTGDSSEFWLDAVRDPDSDTWYWAYTSNAVNLEFIPEDPSPGDGNFGVLTSDSTLLGHSSSNEYHFICQRAMSEPMFCNYEEGWHMSGSNCYSVSDYKDSWLNAELYCQLMNGHLVTINDEDEHFYVLDEALSNHDNIWIGMTEINHADHFSWIGDNSSNYTNWNLLQSMPVSMNGQASAVVDEEDPAGLWVTELETNSHTFLCERPTGSCVMGWEQFGKSCYYFNRQEVDIVTWHTAYDLCNDIGTHLLVIDSQEEDDYISSQLTEEEKMWIGLYYNASTKEFEWVDGQPYTHNLTHMSQEDEDAVVLAGEEKCVSAELIATSDGRLETWTPLVCEDTHAYVCEVPAGTPVYIHTPPLDQHCPDEWALNLDFCYYASDYEDTWTSSESYCNSQGGHLASVTSWSEQDFIRINIHGNSWIGLNDRNEESNFVWSDGDSLIIQNWVSGEPYGEDNNCVMMEAEEGYWTNLKCSELNYFVCKRDYSTTPLAPAATTTPGPGEGNCGEGWEEDTTSGICYAFVDELLAFEDARLHCQEMRVSEGQSAADVVSIGNLDEQRFVQGMVERANVQDPGVFIGLKNDNVAEALYWTNGDPVSFLNYVDGAPGGSAPNYCTEMYNDGEYKWKDFTCYDRLPFICEKKGASYQPPTPHPVSADCPDGWTSHNEYCYYVGMEIVTWDEAKAACPSKYGSTLTSIMDDSENQFLYDLTFQNSYDIWIGMRGGTNGSYDTWVDGSAVVYKNWYPGEPNDQDGLESCVEMMLSFWGGEGTWNDMPCDTTQYFVCKTIYKTCPEGWSQHDGKCYFIGPDQRSWSGAQDACKEVDGEASLLSWHSQEEVTYVQDLINDTFGLTWLGLYHNDGEAWQWEDGTDADFINWRPGQPDHNDTEFCGLTVSNPDDTGFGLLENYPCNNSHYFACEFFPTHTVGCDSGWDYYDGYCYYRSSTNSEGADLDDARSRCLAMGADHTSIWSAEENDFLMSLVQGGSYTYHTIGLRYSEADRLFFWTDGSPVIFTDLPFFGYSPSGTDCYTITNYLQMWVRMYNYAMPYICKKPATITSLRPPASGCLNNDHLYHGTSCYAQLSTGADYNTAAQQCSDSFQGSHLVSVQNQIEEAYLSAYLTAVGEKVWIGLQETISSDGTVGFKWDDGTDYTYANWGEYEPQTDAGECIYISGAQSTLGLWYVSDCSKSYPALCEYERQGYTTAAPPVTTVGLAKCAGDWTLYSSTQSCYKVMTNSKSQALAEQSCAQYGGHLISIHSEQEEIFIKKLPDSSALNSSSFWIGLAVAEENGGYVWLDGTVTDFLHWANGQPNTHELRDTCVTASLDTLEWYDAYCDGFLPYVCKAPQGQMIQSTAHPITSAPDVTCPDFSDDPRWLKDGDHCYRIFSESEEQTQSWREAMKACEHLGANLVSILSQAENSFLLSKVYKYSDDSLWTGGYAYYEEGFKWSDGEPFDFKHWDAGEPNSQLDQESCIALFPQKFGYWNDDNCGTTKGYVCKKPVGGTAAPLTTAPPSDGHCPSGWLHAAGKCVQLVAEKLTFDDARQRCRDSGVHGDLVSIHGSAMQAAVTVIMNMEDQPSWIGLRMAGGVFKWVDETDFTFDNWGAGEPNQAGEDPCVQAVHLSGMWEDLSCLQNRSFICARNPESELSTDSPPPRCSSPLDQYLNYSGGCYRAVTDALTWQEAEDLCKTDGTNLVSIESIAENALVYGIALDAGMEEVWLGLNSKKDPEQYRWSDTFPVLYTKWGPDQPNTSDTAARCVMLSVSQEGAWYNEPCEAQKPSFCKYTAEPIPTADPPVDGNCPNFLWQDFGGGYCYLLVTDAIKTWNDASVACSQEGAALASIHSQEEQDLIQKASVQYTLNLWIGLIQASADYIWTDGTALDYVHWADNEPSSDSELCVEMYSIESRVWNDIDCNVKRAYVCKAKKVNGNGGVSSTLPPPPGPGETNAGGLSGGAIAGIVIACLVVVVAVGGASYYYRDKLEDVVASMKSSSSGGDTGSHHSQNMPPRDEEGSEGGNSDV